VSRLLAGARSREGVALLVIVLAVVAAPVIGSRFWMYNLTIVALYAITVVGLNALVGQAGQVSFAQTTFMAIGGYGVAILSRNHHWNPWLAMLAAALLAAGAAVSIGVPILRLRGHYLAMATFALALGTFALATGAEGLTGGAVGISAVPPLAIGPLVFTDLNLFYPLAWLVCALSVLAVLALQTSFVGRAWRALATREDVAASLGIGIRAYKVLALVVAAVLASIGGSLYVEFTSFVSPDLYDASVIVNLFVMLFLGGRGSVLGPLAGAALVILLPLLIAGLADLRDLVFDLITLAVILVRPQGILGSERGAAPLESLLPRWLLRRLRERAAA